MRETEEDTEELELRERQLRNVPEDLDWWYRVVSKTVGRYCNVHAGFRERSGTTAIGKHQ